MSARAPTRGNFKHGHKRKGAQSPTYCSWLGMANRCSPTSSQRADYFERGIRICDRWRNFENFLADMGERPFETTLDRVDNDRGYEPGNCRWATKTVQSTNRRCVRLLAFNGQTKTLSEWARTYGLTRTLVRDRIDREGWPLSKALTTPARKVDLSYLKNRRSA